MVDRPRVVIVGAGIIGASLALHLKRRGAPVTVIEAASPGGIATRASWAWINASWGNPETYFRLRHRSMRDWHQLVQDVPELTVNWCGGLIWDMPPDELETYVTQHAAWGYDIRRVNQAEIRQREPALAEPPAVAAYVAEEGSVEPLAAAQTLLAAADALGAEIVSPATVEAIDMQAGRAVGVVTGTGRIAADHVILAAGVATTRLAATAGFLPFNFPVARIFLGDVGSGALGYALAALVALLSRQDFGSTALALLPLSAFAIDATLTLASRIVRGERWWTPHVQHAYQRLARRSGRHGPVVLGYAAWTVAALLLAALLRRSGLPTIMGACCAWYLVGAGIWRYTRCDRELAVTTGSRE